MIFAMVHMVYKLQLDGILPALFFAGYCIGRLLGATATSYFFGMSAMFLGTLCGNASHLAILLAPDSSTLFGIAMFVMGFTETVTGIDLTMKLEVLVEDYDVKEEQLLFRLHFVAVTAGSIIAYFGGGWVYENHGAAGVAWSGFASSSLGCATLALYFCYRPQWCKHVTLSLEAVLNDLLKEENNVLDQAGHTLDEGSQHAGLPQVKRASVGSTGSTGSAASVWSAMGQLSWLTQRQRASQRSQASCCSRISVMTDCMKSAGTSRISLRGVDSCILAIRESQESPSESSKKSLRSQSTYSKLSDTEQRRVVLAGWSIVLSYFVTAMPIGQNFALTALFWKAEWEKGTSFSGLLMAVGEILGLVTLVPLASRGIFNSSLLKACGMPMNLVVATLVSSLCVAGIIVPQMEINMVACISVHVVNVLLHTFCNEICAAWVPCDVYADWVGRCYFSKRASNTSMALGASALFMYLGSRTPYLITAIVVGLWGLALFEVYRRLRLLPGQQESNTSCTSATMGEGSNDIPALLGNLHEQGQAGTKSAPEDKDDVCKASEVNADAKTVCAI